MNPDKRIIQILLFLETGMVILFLVLAGYISEGQLWNWYSLWPYLVTTVSLMVISDIISKVKELKSPVEIIMLKWNLDKHEWVFFGLLFVLVLVMVIFDKKESYNRYFMLLNSLALLISFLNRSYKKGFRIKENKLLMSGFFKRKEISIDQIEWMGINEKANLNIEIQGIVRELKGDTTLLRKVMTRLHELNPNIKIVPEPVTK